jgi:glycosyltransferase involved in cell wall biosynthesis
MTASALRVLYLLPAEGFGGAERQGLLHVAELPRHGVEVTALVGAGAPMLRALGEHWLPGAEPFDGFLDKTPKPFSPWASTAYALGWLRAFRRSARDARRRAREQSFQVIFANRTFAWLVAASVSKNLGIPYVIRAGSRPSRSQISPALLLLDRLAPPAAMLSNCRAVEREIAPWFRCPSHILPNAVDTERFKPGSMEQARFLLGLPADAPLVGLAARPAPDKGFELLARVIAALRRRVLGVCFVIAGDFGFRRHYEQLLEREGLKNSVRFLGHVEQMPDFYRAMDVVVLTSREGSIEGSPNALLEAMACQRPLVATAVGGVPELVRHGREGYLTSDDDSQAFAAHLRRLLESRELRMRMGLAGRARAVSRHRLPLVGEELACLLRSVAGTPEPAALELSRGTA